MKSLALILLLLTGSIGLLAGCGQTGDLYLPDEGDPNAPKLLDKHDDASDQKTDHEDRKTAEHASDEQSSAHDQHDSD